MTLRSCFLSSFFEFYSAVSERKSITSLPIRGQGSHVVFDRPVKHSSSRGCWCLAFWLVSLNFRGFREVEKKRLSQAEVRVTIFFCDRSEKHFLGRGRWDIASCEVSLNSVRRRSRKCLGQSVARAIILFFFDQSPEKTKHLVEDIKILVPVRFRWILFSGFRYVKNIAANRKQGPPFCFFFLIGQKHKLCRGRWNLASYQVSLNSCQRFKRSWKCLSKSYAKAAISFFWLTRKNKLVRMCLDLASCQISLNPVSRFRRDVENEKN